MTRFNDIFGKKASKLPNWFANSSAAKSQLGSDSSKESVPFSVDSDQMNIFHLIILDASGSMQSIKGPTIDGFNMLIEGIKSDIRDFPEQSHFISLIQFNSDQMKKMLWLQPAANAIHIDAQSYFPNGGTPLLDAMGMGCLSLETDINHVTDAKVVVNIITDGEENASRNYTLENIQTMVARLEEKGWIFTYIGANHDAMATAAEMNIKNHMSYEANEQDVDRMFAREVMAKKRMMNAYSKGESLKEKYYEEEDK